MIVLLLFLALDISLIGLYAAQNPGTEGFKLWLFQWSGVPHWLPLAASAALVALMFIAYLSYSGVLAGVRSSFLRRHLNAHEATIDDLRSEVRHLRDENARLRGQLPGIGERMRAIFRGRQSAGS
jgi:hypothetical protein